MFRQEDTVDPGSFTGAKDSSEVVRILDAIEQHDQGRRSKMFENRFRIDVRALALPGENADNALVPRVSRHVIECLPLSPLDRYSGPLRGLENLVDPITLTGVGDTDSLQSSALCARARGRG